MIDKKNVTIETTSCVIKGKVKVSMTLSYDDDNLLQPLTQKEILQKVFVSSGLALEGIDSDENANEDSK